MRLLALALAVGLSALTALYIAAPAHAANVTWDGGGGVDTNWSTAANWTGDALPLAADVAVFDSTSSNNVTMDVAALSIAGISITAAYAGTITQAGTNTITLGASGFVQAGGTFTGGSGSFTVAGGSFTLSGGTFTSTSGTLSVSGGWTHSAGTFTHNSGTVQLTGAAATIDVPTTETFNNLTINPATAGATKTVANGDQLIVDGTLTLSEGIIGQAASAPATGTVVANGNISQANPSDGGSGVATLFISGAGTQTFTGTATLSFGNLPATTINKTGGSLTLSGLIRTNQNWTFSLSGGATFDAGSSTVNFAGGTITGPGTFNNVTFNASAAKAITGAVTIAGTLNFSGTGAIGGTGSLEAQGNIQQATNTALSGGTATANSAALNIVGIGDQTFSGFATPTTSRLPPVTINKPSGTLTLSSGIRTDRNWTYTAGTVTPGTSTLSFAGISGLTVTGSHTLNNVNIGGGTATAVPVTIAGGTTLTATGTTTLTDGSLLGTGFLDAQGAVSQGAAFDGGTGTLRLSGGSATLTGNVAGDLPNVDIQKGANTLTLSGTVRTTSNWTYTSGTISAAGSTLLFAGNGGTQTITGTHTVNAVTFNHGTADGTFAIASGTTLTAGGTVTLTEGQINTGTLAAQGDVTQASTFDGGSGTLLVNGGGAQTFTGTATTSAGSLPAVNIDKSGGTLTLSGTIRTAGNWTYTAGGFDAVLNSTTLVAAGGAISGTHTLYNLDVRANSTIGSGTVTVEGTLTLGAQTLDAGSNKVALTASGAISRTSGYVIGNLQRNVATGATSVTFHIGDGSGYTPVVIAFNSVTTPGDLTARTTGGDHADIAASGIDPAKSVNRFYTLTNSGVAFDNYNATFTFLAGDVDGGADTAQFRIARKSGTWSLATAGTRTATTTQGTGITALGTDYVIGETDTTAPTVSSVSSSTADGTKKIGDTIAVTVTFSEAAVVVTSGGTPTIELETGTTDRTAAYASGTGTATLTFNYTVVAGDIAADLDYTGTGALVLNGGTIKDGSGNDATLTLASPGAAGSLGANKALVVDGIRPLVTGVSSSTANGSYKAADTIAVTVTFDDTVTVTTGGGTPTIELETGTTDRTAAYASGSGGTTLTFNYTVVAGDTSNDLDYTGTGALALNGGTIRDAAGNDATLTLVSPGAAGSLAASKALIVDTTAPTVSGGVDATDGSYKEGAVIAITVGFSETVNVTTGGGTPRLQLGVGGPTRYATYASGTGSATLTFNYTVVAGDTAADLDYTATTALDANGGTIRDAVGNDATLTLSSPGAAGSLAANAAVIVDTTPPTVTNVSSSTANGTKKIGDVIAVTVTFAEPVDVTTGGGTPTILLETGTTDRTAAYASGTGTATLTFNYTVAAGDVAADLDYTSTGALALNGGTIRDPATNNATLTLPTVGGASSIAGQKALVVDGVRPAVTGVDGPDGGYGTGQNVDLTIAFDDSVTVDTGGGTPRLKLNVGGATRYATYLSGSPGTTLTFRYTVAVGDASSDLDYDATTSLEANGGTIRDAAGNDATLTLATPGAAGSLAANAAITINAGPTVTDVSASTANGSYNAGDTISVTITFSESVTVVGGPPTILLETGTTDRTAAYASGSPGTVLTFNYTVQAGDTSADLDYVATDSLALNGATIRNGASADASIVLGTPGAAGSLAANKAIVIDTTAPTVSSVSSSTANGTYKIGDTIAVTVTFSEAVAVVTSGGTPTILLETGATDRTATYASGTGTSTLTFNYTVAAGDTAADLDYVATASLALNGGTIRDAAGNDATLTLASPGAAGSLGANKALVVDGIRPLVTGVSASTANGSYKAADTIAVTVTFDDTVTVTTGGGTPTIELETGTTDRTAAYASGSGGTTLTFNYTVSAGDTSNDLDYTGTGALALNGGTIRDGNGNDATLTLASPAAAGSLGANKALIVDTTAPTVSSAGSSTANGTYKAGDVIAVTVTFAETVNVTTGGGTPTIELETGTTDRTAAYASGSGGATLTFNYTVQAGDASSDLDYTSTGALALNGGTIRDPAGNDATLTLPTVGGASSIAGQKALVVDGVAPTVTGGVDAPDGSYKEGAVVAITVGFSETVNVTTGGGTPRLQLGVGGPTRYATYASGTGSATLTFNYTVVAGDTAADLDYTATTALEANGGTIRDTAGNDATLTLASPGAAGSLAASAAVIVDTAAPAVTNVSSSTSNGSYKAGDTIAVTVTFSEAVTVATGGGTPTVELETGVADRTAAYNSGSGTSTLTFTYTITAGDASADLDYTSTGALALNGGTIRDAATNNATLTLPTVGGASSIAGQKALVVDTLAPTLSSADVSASTLTLTYGESLASVNPATGQFTVTLNSGPATIGVTGVLASGTTVTLTLASAVTPTDTITVGYVVPGSNFIQDPAGNAAAAFSSQAVTNSTVDTTTPTFVSAATNNTGTRITLTFNEGLTDTSATTPVSAFTVTATPGGALTISSIAVSGGTVTLYLLSSVTASQSLVFTYTQPGTAANRIRDAAGNDAASISTTTVTNNVDSTPPALTNKSVNGATLTLTYDDELNTGSVPATSAYTVSGRTVTAVAIVGSTVRLTVSPAVVSGETGITVRYVVPGASPVEDDGLNDAAAIDPAQAVTNATPSSDATPPSLSTQSVNAATLTLTFTEALVTPGPSASAFTVRVNGTLRTVTAAVTSGTTVTLTLSSAVVAGEAVTVGYTVPGSEPLRDANGNSTASFSLIAVTNATPEPAPSGGGGGGGGGGAPPALVSVSPADGSIVSGVSLITLTANVSVAWTNITITVPDGGTVALGGAFGTTAVRSFSTTTPGLYTIRATLSDGGSAPLTVVTHFTIWLPPATPSPTADAPPASKTALPAETGSLTSSDGRATVNWTPGTFGDSVVVTVDPVPPSTTPTGPAISAGDVVVEVTAALTSNGTAVRDLGGAGIDIHFPGADPAAVPSTSADGSTWRPLPQLTTHLLPAGQADGYFRDSAGTVHVITRHLTYFGLLRPTAFGALTMKVVSAKRVSLAVRKYVAVRVQVSAASQLKTSLVDPRGKSAYTWPQRSVKAGTTILRLTLPATLSRTGSYRIQVRAASRGQTVGRTVTVQLLTAPPTTPFTPAGKKVGVVVVKSDLIKNLKLDERFSVRPVTGSQVFDVTGLRTAFVEGVVIDLDRESVATIAGLRQVFPELRIVALSNSPTAAAYARRAGASIVIMKPTSPELVAALVRQLIWR